MFFYSFIIKDLYIFKFMVGFYLPIYEAEAISKASIQLPRFKELVIVVRHFPHWHEKSPRLVPLSLISDIIFIIAK